MAEIKTIRKCYHCGAILQSEDKTAPGYISPQAFNEESLILFCDSCYEEERQKQNQFVPSVSKDFFTILDDAIASDALIVYVIDLFSFESSFIPSINQYIKGQKVVIVANKRDLLTPLMKDEDIIEHVAHRLRVAHFDIKGIVLASSTHDYNIKEVLSKIETLRQRHDVYLIGASSSGKTSLMNMLLKNYKNSTRHVISSYTYPGTDLRVTEVPLDNSSSLFDCPGIALNNSIISNVERELERVIIPITEVLPRKIILVPGQSVFLGGLTRVDLVGKEKTTLEIYISPDIEIKKVSAKNMDEYFINTLERKTIFPVSASHTALSEFDIVEVDVTETGKRDLGISGLGWISFEGAEQTFRFYVPKGVGIYNTRAKIKIEDKNAK